MKNEITSKIINGDCIEEMKKLEDNSEDAWEDDSIQYRVETKEIALSED